KPAAVTKNLKYGMAIKKKTKKKTPRFAGLLGALALPRGFDRKRGIAAPAAARHECHDCRPNLFIAGGSDFLPARARNDVQNFLRSVFHRYPVRASTAH